MSKADKEKAREIVSLNDDWAGFDLENLSVEELEQRFEMSLIALPPIVMDGGEGGSKCTCGDLKFCGSYCN